jgi:hypothetical protein
MKQTEGVVCGALYVAAADNMDFSKNLGQFVDMFGILRIVVVAFIVVLHHDGLVTGREFSTKLWELVQGLKYIFERIEIIYGDRKECERCVPGSDQYVFFDVPEVWLFVDTVLVKPYIPLFGGHAVGFSGAS